MKIAILGTRGIPNHYGGFEQAAQYLAGGLVERGHEVYVYNSHRHPYQDPEWNGVRIIHCYDPEHNIGTAGQFLYDLNCIRDARKRDLDILLHLGYTSDAVWCKRWPRKAINIVNMDGMEWKRAKYNAITRKFLKWSESLAVRHAQVLVADSRGIQEHLVNSYGKQAVYIPYGTALFGQPDPGVLKTYGLRPQQYFLVLARMEPENNIEMIIKGWLLSNRQIPLLVVGNIDNKFGQYLRRQYPHSMIRFLASVYDRSTVDNLRYFARIYFHGHSVGGTNPSLLEAMACSCTIAAHDNLFNQAVLGDEAYYFSSEATIAALIDQPGITSSSTGWKEKNMEKIRTLYTHERIVDAYEQMMLEAVSKRSS